MIFTGLKVFACAMATVFALHVTLQIFGVY